MHEPELRAVKGHKDIVAEAALLLSIVASSISISRHAPQQILPGDARRTVRA